VRQRRGDGAGQPDDRAHRCACKEKNTSGWTAVTVDLAAFAGQTVTLRFHATLNGDANSNFFLDDVAFIACPGGDGGGSAFRLFLPTMRK